MKSTIYLIYILGVATDAVSSRSVFTRSDSPTLDLMAQLVGSPLFSSFRRVPASSTVIPSKIRKDAVRKKVRWGPYTLPGANETTFSTTMTKEKGSLLSLEALAPICKDCIALTGAITLEHPDGSLANLSTGVYNHHVVVLNMGKTQHMMVCPGSTSPRVPPSPALFLGGASDDTVTLFTAADGNFKTGYYIKPTDTLVMVLEIMNYSPQKQDVYVVADVEWIEGKPEGYMDTITLPISVGDCNNAEFMITQDRYNKTSGDWVVPADGFIMNMQGHLHDGGDSVVVELNGKSVCTSMATYGAVPAAGGHAHGGGGMRKAKRSEQDEVGLASITHMGKCEDAIPIKKGDKLRVSANFDLVKHPLRKSTSNEPIGVMGIGVFNFAFPIGTKLD